LVGQDLPPARASPVDGEVPVLLDRHLDDRDASALQVAAEAVVDQVGREHDLAQIDDEQHHVHVARSEPPPPPRILPAGLCAPTGSIPRLSTTNASYYDSPSSFATTLSLRARPLASPLASPVSNSMSSDSSCGETASGDAKPRPPDE